MAPNPPPPPLWKNQRIRGALAAWTPKKEFIYYKKYLFSKLHNFMNCDCVENSFCCYDICKETSI